MEHQAVEGRQEALAGRVRRGRGNRPRLREQAGDRAGEPDHTDPGTDRRGPGGGDRRTLPEARAGRERADDAPQR